MFDITHHIPATLLLGDMQDKVYEGNYTNLARNQLMHDELHHIYKEFIETKDIAPNYYPYLKQMRELFAGKLSLEEDQVVMVPGSDFSISLILSQLSVQYKKMILFYPNYYNYETYGAYHNWEIFRLNQLWKSEEEILDELCQKMSEFPGGLVVLTNPDGLLGREFSKSFLTSVLLHGFENNYLVLIDQAYSSFGSIDAKDLLMKFTNLIIINSFSKSFGMAGLRFGMCFTTASIAKHLRKSGIELALTMFTLEYFRFLYIEKSSQIKSIIQDIKNERRDFTAYIKKACPLWEAVPSHANFVSINMHSQDNAYQLTDILKVKGILIRPLAKLSSDLDTYIRITVGSHTIMENIKQHISTYYEQRYA